MHGDKDGRAWTVPNWPFGMMIAVGKHANELPSSLKNLVAKLVKKRLFATIGTAHQPTCFDTNFFLGYARPNSETRVRSIHFFGEIYVRIRSAPDQVRIARISDVLVQSSDRARR